MRLDTRPRDARPGRRRLIAIAAAALLTLIGLVAPAAAQAAELDAITSATIVEPSSQVHLYDTIRLEATWAVPDTAQPGDTFSLSFPTTPQLVGISSTFQMLDPDGATIGTCTVSATGIACTLSDYVATHDNVQGTLFFQVKAEQTTEEGTLTFTTGGGVPIIVQIPGGGILPQEPNPVPTDALKTGSQTVNGGIEWYIWVPGSLLTGQNPTIIDTFTPGLTLLPGTIWLGHVATADWNDGFFDPSLFTTLTPETDYSLTVDTANSFTLELAAPALADHLYRLQYQTQLPAGVQTGDVFENTVTGSSFTTTTATLTVTTAGGGGDGDGLGGFTVSKAISGEGASLVPDDASFIVDYSYSTAEGPVTGSLTLAADGTTQSVQGIPVDTVVTLSERPAAPVAGVVWGESVFSGAGVTVVDGAAQLTIGDDTTVAAQLTNSTTLAPPVFGGFSVSKQITGNATSLIPDDATFVVDYAYATDEGQVTGSLALAADGAPQTVQDLAVGTVVTLTERPATPVTGVVWGEPVFSGQGVTVVSGGAQLTIGAETTVAAQLANPAALVPPPSDPPRPPTAGLATTGGDAGPMAALLTLAMLMVGAGIVLTRRAAILATQTRDVMRRSDR